MVALEVPPFTALAYNIVTGEQTAELKVSRGRFTEALNAPGGFDLTFLKDGLVEDDIASARTAIYIDRGGIILFGGIIWVDQTDDGPQVRVGGEGFPSYYREGRRTVRGRSAMTYATGANGLEITWTARDPFDIVNDLMAHADVFDARPGFAGVRFHGPSAGGRAGWSASRTLWVYELKSIWEVIEDLSGQDPGFDFAVNIEWVNNEPTRYLDLYYPRRGTASGNVIFDTSKNARLRRRSHDGKHYANVVSAIGAGNGDSTRIANAVDNPQTATNPVLELVRNYRSEGAPANLAAHARTDLAVAVSRAETMTFEVLEDIDLALTSFNVGDTALCNVVDEYGYLSIAGNYRIIERVVELGDDGSLKIEATVANEAATLGVS